MTALTRWKLILPLLQFIFALMLWLYLPFQFESQITRAMKPSQTSSRQSSSGLAPEVRALFYPPPAGRVLYAINLPASLLSDQIESRANGSPPAWEFRFPANDGKTLGLMYVVGIREILFFIGIILLWSWVGSKVDEYILARRGITIQRLRGLKIIEMVITAGLAAFLLVACFICIQPAKCFPPERQIMSFGLIWPVLLLAYFIFSLRQEFRKSNRV